MKVGIRAWRRCEDVGRRAPQLAARPGAQPYRLLDTFETPASAHGTRFDTLHPLPPIFVHQMCVVPPGWLASSAGSGVHTRLYTLFFAVKACSEPRMRALQV